MTDWKTRAFRTARAFDAWHYGKLKREREEDKESIRSELRGRALAELEVDDLRAAVLPPPTISVAHADYIGAQVVYVIWPVGDVYVKIGITVNLVSRLGSLQVGNARDMYLLVAFHQGEFHWTERLLQDRFAPQSKRGEWFVLADDLAQWLAPAQEEALVRGPGVPFDVRPMSAGFARRTTRGGRF